jgi:hypothetical protein
MNVSQYPSSCHGSIETSFTETSSARRSLPKAQAYLALLASAIRGGKHTSFEVRGGCMWPAIRPGDRVRVGPLRREPRVGDVLICYRGIHAVAHRVVQHFHDAHGHSWVRCRGDAALALDAPVRAAEVLGLVHKVERAGCTVPPRAEAGFRSRFIAPLRAAFGWLSAQRHAWR